MLDTLFWYVRRLDWALDVAELICAYPATLKLVSAWPLGPRVTLFFQDKVSNMIARHPLSKELTVFIQCFAGEATVPLLIPLCVTQCQLAFLTVQVAISVCRHVLCRLIRRVRH
jgi:hypothetical protein